LIAACEKCNLKKADRTPDEADMPLLWPARAPSDESDTKKMWKYLKRKATD
jgi:5-methylcytosine-specific restriction endonuclease McrA